MLVLVRMECSEQDVTLTFVLFPYIYAEFEEHFSICSCNKKKNTGHAVLKTKIFFTNNLLWINLLKNVGKRQVTSELYSYWRSAKVRNFFQLFNLLNYLFKFIWGFSCSCVSMEENFNIISKSKKEFLQKSLFKR